MANSRSTSPDGHGFGGVGWIIDPNGEVLAETDAKNPFITRDVDFSQAVLTKHSYPRNVAD